MDSKTSVIMNEILVYMLWFLIPEQFTLKVYTISIYFIGCLQLNDV